MANIAYDFLSDSILFRDDHIKAEYASLSEDELRLELRKYREHIQKNLSGIVEEIKSDKAALNISIETLGSLPDETLLKQLALYLDRVVLPDPLFEYTEEKGNMHEPMSMLMNIAPLTKTDRKGVAYSASYMKWTTPLVVNQFIKYMPISIINEAPRDIPILYSKDNFAKDLPENIYKFFYERVKVSNIEKIDGKMSYCEDEQLHLGTCIAINFDREHVRRGHIYQFVETKYEEIDEKTGKFKILQYLPDNISKQVFDSWVSQSINRAAIAEYRTTLNELLLSKQLDCMYLAKSKFTADLLKQTVQEKGVKSDLTNLSMELELPVSDKISLNDLVSIRYNNGEAFHNFRSELNSKLLELRTINNKEELESKLQNVAYELNELQVHDVKKEFRKIIGSLGVDATILTGSLLTSFCTGGLTMVGAAGAIVKGGADYTKYINQVKENNGYFLWKLNKKAKL